MTWGEIKRAIEAYGVKDEDEINYLDFSIPRNADRSEDGAWCID